MFYADALEYRRMMEGRRKEVAAELRRKGYAGQALQDELARRAANTRAHVLKQLERQRTTSPRGEASAERFWRHWQAGGRAKLLAECDALGI